ncbi:MAG TPA: alpha/beta hydrolase family protein [Terriglobia bacterium]|nr:alpha/beta hydrolase family protein [Terriglobia bacterium]
MTKLCLPLVLISLCLLGGTSPTLLAQTPEDINFLTDLPDFEHIKNLLPDYLNRIGIEFLDERQRTVAQISTATQVAGRKAYVRERMLSSLGGLPDRSPLNARVVGGFEREGYRIEKVIFESQPRFYVTGNLYVPTTGQPPYPGVLLPLGHERGGKSNADWQHVLVSLARRGFVVFTWDPLGQGERSQFYAADFETSELGETAYTTEHTMIGAQCLLAGDNLARYTIWDGMRALDYLVSRPEVDPNRIACTGNSGGGTHTAYLSVLDDRIKVGAPSCYVTSWRRLLESIGPQDAEQCLPPFLKDGLDHADFIYAFAPKPFLMLSAIRDFFSISGARESFQDASRIYALMGSPDKLQMSESDNTHGYRLPRRLAAYNWLSLWLKGREDRTPEQEVQLEPDSELNATESGQVSTSLGGETVFSLNLKRVEKSKSERETATPNRAEIERKVRQLTAFEQRSGELVVKPFGKVQAKGYTLEKMVYESVPGVIVPALLFVPDHGETAKPAVVYVNDKGKSAGWGPDGDVERLVNRGFIVLAIDPRGWGETRAVQNPDEDTETYRLFGDYPNAMRAFLIGKTLVGMRAEDISCGVDLLAARPEVNKQRIYGYGVGAGALMLLHEAVLDGRIRGAAFDHMLVSYHSVVTHRVHRDIYESVVPGVLKAYDLPDLVAALAPRPVWLVDAVDPLGMPVPLEETRKQYSSSIEAFKVARAETALHILTEKPEQHAQAF